MSDVTKMGNHTVPEKHDRLQFALLIELLEVQSKGDPCARALLYGIQRYLTVEGYGDLVDYCVKKEDARVAGRVLTEIPTPNETLEWLDALRRGKRIERLDAWDDGRPLSRIEEVFREQAHTPHEHVIVDGDQCGTAFYTGTTLTKRCSWLKGHSGLCDMQPIPGSVSGERFAPAANLVMSGGIYLCPCCQMPLSGTPEGHLPDCIVRECTEKNLINDGWKSPYPPEPTEERLHCGCLPDKPHMASCPSIFGSRSAPVSGEGPKVKLFTGERCAECQQPIAWHHVIEDNTHAPVVFKETVVTAARVCPYCHWNLPEAVSGEGGERPGTFVRNLRHLLGCTWATELPTGGGYWGCGCGLDKLLIDLENYEVEVAPSQSAQGPRVDKGT